MTPSAVEVTTERVPEAVESLPLARDFSSRSGSAATVSGPHRFVQINNKWGFHPQSLDTTLSIPSTQHTEDRGSFVLWISPLESLGVAPALEHVKSRDANWTDYGILADVPRTNDVEHSTFAWYWRNTWHPQMIAKFKSGPAGNTAADYAVTPYVPVEHMPLHEHQWYQLAFTWDKPASRFRIYLNGILCGTTRFPFTADTPHPELYLGNTAMAFADLDIYDHELTGDTVAALFAAAGIDDGGVRQELLDLYTVQPRDAIEWTPAEGWVKQYERDLTHAGDFDGWRQEGCLAEPFLLTELGITDEGLLVQTPDEVHTESRVYFWSPDQFEGDLAVQYDFRPESDTGLALLVAQATGMHGEDFLTDHPARSTGAMTTIIADRVRNYHWEFYRQAVDVRGDLGTQILVKNPWFKPLGMVSLPPLEIGQWHRLLFIQEGPRIRAGLDGEWVFDILDDSFAHSGPVLRGGRIGLRLMYGTRMSFRNLTVWNRDRWNRTPG